MRRFIITVNGKSYDVGVREVGEDEAAPAAELLAAPSGAPAAREPEPEAPARPAAPAKAEKGPAEGAPVRAPMPGTIVRIDAAPGRTVKKDEVLLILEAMKMENEITAPADGVVVSVEVAKGDAVESGRPLVYIRAQ